jgi:hypothetical protein
MGKCDCRGQRLEMTRDVMAAKDMEKVIMFPSLPFSNVPEKCVKQRKI